MAAGLFAAAGVALFAHAQKREPHPPDPESAGPAADAKQPDYNFKLQRLGSNERVELKAVGKDKYVVVFFWASDCPLCETALPHVQEVADYLAAPPGPKSHRDDIVLLTIALDSMPDKVLPAYMRNGHFKFTVLLDPMGRRTKDAYRLEKDGVPLTYVFNRKGQVVGAIQGFQKDLLAKINNLINLDRQNP
jgi:thiol-disulfide isomerase/thioredoxin